MVPQISEGGQIHLSQAKIFLTPTLHFDQKSTFPFSNKSSYFLLQPAFSKHLHNLPTSITMGNAQIPFKQSLKSLGFTLDCHLTMNAHVSNIARTCYFELRRLASIRRFLTSTATATLVSAYVLSRIDYCNSLLFGSTHDVTSNLQRTMTYNYRCLLPQIDYQIYFTLCSHV